MQDTITVRAPRRAPKAVAVDCVLRVQAEIVSLGGAVLLTLCLLLTAVLIMALFSPTITGVQRFIAVVLTFSGWMYLLRSASEDLSIVGQTITYRAVLARTRTIPLADIETMLLVHQGLNLEKGIETIEFRRFDKKVEHLSLGPCWQRHKLEAFLGSVEEALHSPKLLESVR
jgi:hypothetical protein